MPYTKPGYIDQEVFEFMLKETPSRYSKKERADLMKKSYYNFYRSAYNNKNTRQVMLNTVTGSQYRPVASVFSRLLMTLARAEHILLEAGVLKSPEIAKGFHLHDLQMMSDNVMKQIEAIFASHDKAQKFDQESEGKCAFTFKMIAGTLIPLDACLADAAYPIYSMSQSLCESLHNTNAPSTEEFKDIFKEYRVHSSGGALFLLPKGFCLSDGMESVDYLFMLETVGSDMRYRPVLIWIGASLNYMQLPLDSDLSEYFTSSGLSPERNKGVTDCVNFGRNLYAYLATYPGKSEKIPLSQIYRPSGFYTPKSPRPQTTRLLDLPQSSSNRKQSRPSNEDHGGTHASPITHWRRGHWRNQVCGEKFSERKMKWIEPVLVNPQHKEAVVTG